MVAPVTALAPFSVLSTALLWVSFPAQTQQALDATLLLRQRWI